MGYFIVHRGQAKNIGSVRLNDDSLNRNLHLEITRKDSDLFSIILIEKLLESVDVL